MNLAVVLMGVAAGIGILASLQHGFVGFWRRPRDPARIAFAAAALAAAVAALAVAALYSVDDIGDHVAVAKWAFYPASVLWTLATVWFVAFASGVRPRWLLATLSAGFLVAIAVDLVLPHGMLHATMGTLVHARILGASVLVMEGAGPNVLHVLTDVLTVLSFAFMCYAVYRVYRRPAPAPSRARYLGPMTALLAVATLLDTINEHSIITTFTTLYLTQICFALVILAVSLALRQESLQVEIELQMYRTQMDALVEARVAELDEANERLVLEARERRATEDVLRRRMEELDALQRMAQILAGRTARGQAIDEATSAIARLFRARYARVRLLFDGETDDGRAESDPRPETGARPDEEEAVQSLTLLDLAASDDALRDQALTTGDAATWPGLPDDLQRQAGADGVGSVLATPLIGTSGSAGALIIVRDRTAGAFSDEDLDLARTVGDALAAVIEIDRLHRKETRQAAEQERQALARDLHDAVTQSIYSASLIAEALPAVWERDPEDGRRNLERLRRLTRAALAEMRTLLFELRPAALETAPLDALIERLGDALAGQAQIDVDIEVADVDLPSDLKIVFYRVTQEAFSNVAKHARATTVSARLLAVDGGATLTVRDDGRGFDPGAVPSGHMGLHIMSERLEHVAGTLTVESSPGAGTTIRAQWPRPASDERPLGRMGA